MPYEYGDYYYEMEETGLGMVIGFYLIYFFVVFAISVGTYILQSLGMYTIAKRREIKNPWLAWLPVGSGWILGCISDQYRYVSKGQVKNKRKVMLVLTILASLLMVVFFALFGKVMMQTVAYDDTMFAVDHAAEMNLLSSVAGMLGVSLIMSGLAIALTVFQYMALYDLFCSCEPKNGVLYLVLSIFFSITLPIFVFICRNKDEGMPPRKTEPELIPQPIREPWENNSEA